ncbi:MAG: DNA alkylation repair protein [Bacteroidales bacterium]|nr:DNA alkylation repair protein [Bacteroidales bacterium]
MTIQERLFSLRDEKYAAFSAKLIPTVSSARFIGVRSPQLRILAKELKNNASGFLSELPHQYHEENMLHAYLLCEEKKYDILVEETERFLPFVDNWAVCDSLAPRAFARHKEDLLPRIRKWMASEHEYTVRFGIGMLMRHFLDADFRPEHLQWVAEVSRGEYYIKMMQAWYFATALAKQWDAALPLLDTLEGWVRGKSIQKALESYRVSDDHKSVLKGLR